MVARKSFPDVSGDPGTADPPSRPADAAQLDLSLRPLVRCRLVSLFEREVREKLTRSAAELLFSAAELLSEGQRTTRGGRDAFLGSTMLTIDLRKLASVLREAHDPRATQRLGALLAKDEGTATRARAVALAEVERQVGRRPKQIEADVRVRSRGTTLYIDVDVEATL